MGDTWRTWFRGKPTCTCVQQWFPAFEAELKRRGLTSGFYDGKHLKIFQLTGGASASAGTHSKGGAIDTASLSAEAMYVARLMGGVGWVRDWPGNRHSHIVLNGCPHNGPARYQITSYLAGYDGLGNGYRTRDPHRRPARLPTWRDGIRYAQANQPKEFDEMASKKEIQDAVRGVVRDEVRAEVSSVLSSKKTLDRIAHAVWSRPYRDFFLTAGKKGVSTVSKTLYELARDVKEMKTIVGKKD